MSKWPPLLAALTLLGCRPSSDHPPPGPSSTPSSTAVAASPRPMETVVVEKGPSPDARVGDLRFDGLYVADSATRKLVRFYPDGSVLTISTRPEVPFLEIVVWFRKGHPQAGTGTYVLDGAHLTFKSTIEGVGAVDYEGTVQPGSARLRWHSLINDAKGEDVYRFVHLPVR